MLCTEAGELPHGFHVGATSVEIADMRAEKSRHSCAGFRPHRETEGRGREVRWKLSLARRPYGTIGVDEGKMPR